MIDWRVNLEIYNGPMDLLLYLIKREEVDIHDIPIARITGQFCDYVETLRRIDPDVAGEFLVLATTLMEVKTRMLLPRPEAPDDDGEPLDPRADLVRQLLEYKAFKDAAGDLRDAAARQALRFPRRPGAVAEDGGTDLDDVQLWDLVEAFNGLLSAIGHDATQTEIIYDDTPVELYAADILDRLTREGNLTFSQIFAGRTERMELIGLFLAVLELAKQRQIFIEQNRPFDEIYVFVNPDAPTAEQIAAEADRATLETARAPAAGDAGPEPAHTPRPEGQYLGRAPEAIRDTAVPAVAGESTGETPSTTAVSAVAGGPADETDGDADSTGETPVSLEAEPGKAERVFALPELDDLDEIARIDDLTDLEGLGGPMNDDEEDDDDTGGEAPRAEP